MESEKSLPLVSVLLLCWNHAAYIEQCINSIVSQDYSNIEILFLDNCSDDQSYEIGNNILANSHISFQCFRNNTPKSVPINVNFLFKNASGKYVTTFSTDDWMASNNISTKVAAIEQNANIGCVLGNGYFYIEPIGTTTEAPREKLKDYIGTDDLLLSPKSYFWCGPLYSSQAIRNVGGWDEKMTIEDLDLNLRIAKNYKIRQITQPLVYYRQHKDAFTRNPKKLLDGFGLYYAKYKMDRTLPINLWYSNFLINIADSYYKNSKIKKTQFYLKAIRVAPKIKTIKDLVKIILS